MTTDAVDLYWLPLGAGGWFVRLNGRIYERVAAWRDGRTPCDLYHSALVVTVDGARHVVEQAWPIPDGHGERRGAVAEGAVATRHAGVLRVLRYETRRWRDGVIADLDEAVGGAHRLTGDRGIARTILELVPQAPAPVWGRDELGTGEMWNSNSLISWLVTRSGLDVRTLRPPAGGRAPGWGAGVLVARRALAPEELTA